MIETKHNSLGDALRAAIAEGYKITRCFCTNGAWYVYAV